MDKTDLCDFCYKKVYLFFLIIYFFIYLKKKAVEIFFT